MKEKTLVSSCNFICNGNLTAVREKWALVFYMQSQMHAFDFSDHLTRIEQRYPVCKTLSVKNEIEKPMH